MDVLAALELDGLGVQLSSFKPRYYFGIIVDHEAHKKFTGGTYGS
ncbi:hypothetical protein ACFLV7_01785 [Chloroflexota bacterium]